MAVQTMSFYAGICSQPMLGNSTMEPYQAEALLSRQPQAHGASLGDEEPGVSERFAHIASFRICACQEKRWRLAFKA